jgi:hypothetical protein
MEREEFNWLVRQFVTDAHRVMLVQGMNQIFKYAKEEEINYIMSGVVGPLPGRLKLMPGDRELFLAETFTQIAERMDGGEMLKNILKNEMRSAAFSSKALEGKAPAFAMLCITPKL